MGHNMVGEKFSSCLTQVALIAIMDLAFTATATHAQDANGKTEDIWQQDKITGDWGGAHTALNNRGIDITIQYIGETLSVLSGGLYRATSYERRLEFFVDADLGKLIGWNGARTHVTVFNIHNSGHIAADNVDAIADPSNIDALPTTRLFTLWFQQNFANDAISIRLGQFAGDDEFMLSDTAGGLINGTFGWAGILAANMTNGGPAYPLATPGARLQIKPIDQLSFLAAVFSGEPAGRNCMDDAQVCNTHGTTFSFYGGALWMAEAQCMVNGWKNAAGLPGVYKIGAWYATTDFPDQRFGIDTVTGLIVSLADPSMPDPLNHQGNWGIYGVVDQMILRNGATNVSLFLRSGVAPSDPNLLSFYIDGGIGIKGLFASRPNDTFTFGVAYARMNDDAADLDRNTLAINGPPYPIRDYEMVFELSYIVEIAPWWTVQPDFQLIVHPGGKVPHPDNPAVTVGNALVAGVRSTITF
jgi:porin